MFPYEQNVQMYGIANNLLAENVHLKKTIEILKNRYPREHDQQYLTTVDGRTGLWLCTSKMNGVQVVSFAMEWTVDRAILAENYSGDENILAVEFTRGTGKFQECREVKVSYGDFCKNGRLFSACLAMGINIPLRMSSNRKEDLLKAYIATQIIPGEIIELPGWYRDGVNWKYMREENLPYITATGLNAEEQPMDVSEESAVIPEEIFGRCMPDYTELGIWIVGVISRLQTLLYCENLEVRTFVNIVVPQGLNDSIIEQVECMLLNPEVIRLPIKKRELHLRLKKARDRAVLLVVEDDCKTQRQIDDLTEVLKIIRTDNNSSEYKGLTKIYLPCVISEVPLGNLTGRDTFLVEVKKIPWQKSECNRLTGFKIVRGLVCFVEKHPEELHEIVDCAKRLRTNDERFSEYLGLLQAMEISERILKKFMKIRRLDMKADYRATERLISNSLSLIEDGGVIEAFVEVFRKLYFSQKLLLCTPGTPIPDDMRHNLWAVETDSTVNFEPAVFESMLKHMPFMVNSLRLMQLLYTENILEADNSGKRSYKKKIRYTKPNGEVAYDRFVVLRKDKLGIGDEIL